MFTRRRIIQSNPIVFGCIIATLGTLSAAGLAAIETNMELPSFFDWILFPLIRPWLTSGAAITWCVIRGDNYNHATDFWFYTVPISLVINTLAGSILGLLWRQWRRRQWRRWLGKKW